MAQPREYLTEGQRAAKASLLGLFLGLALYVLARVRGI